MKSMEDIAIKEIASRKSLANDTTSNIQSNMSNHDIYDKIIEQLSESRDNDIPLEEGLFGSIFGGLVGATAGPALGKALCKALSIDERGMLGNLLTSRVFLTALGGYIGWKN